MAIDVLITLCGPGGGLSFREVALKTFCGKPIAHYSLAAALLFLETRDDLRADIVLNTDSGLLREGVTGLYPEVACLQRPAALSGEVPRLEVFRQSLREMEARRQSAYQYHIDLDLAVPLRRPQDIAACFAKLEQRSELDAVIAGSKTRRNPYTDYARREGDYVGPLVPGEGDPPPDCYDLHGSVSCLRRDFLAREDDPPLFAACFDVCEIPAWGIEGPSVADAFPFYETIGRQLFQSDPDYKQVRGAIR